MTDLDYAATRGEGIMFSVHDEAVYRQIVELSQEGICIADEHGRFSFVNPRCAEMLQVPASDLLGKPARDFIAVEDRLAFDERYRERRIGRGKHTQAELTLLRGDGSPLRVLSTTTSFYDGNGLNGVLCMMTDREQEVSRRNDLAAHIASMNEDMQTFTYSVTHDLHAPLRAIDGFARELQLDGDSTLSARGTHYVERIRAAAMRMRDTINSLLDLSTASRRELERQRVDLSSFARSIAMELEDPARSIVFDIAPRVPASGDPQLLRIMLDNLLGNAVKFTAKTAAAQISFGTLESDHGPVYFVRDNGAGFDPKHAPNLFAPFQRFHPAGEFEGRGIGLATVQRIVQRHGGRVWAEGVPGEGAVFYFTLGDLA